MKMLLILLLFLSLTIISCETENGISDTPKISFRSIYPSVVKAFNDSITIEINYEDGNGDLGENDANSKNLFVTDSRNNLIESYRIQQLSPNNSTKSIKGILKIIIPYTSLIEANADNESLNYLIKVIDRANNSSNEIQTNNITVIR